MIYVISRISGEGKDRRKVKGDYYLSEREEEDLRYLAEMNKPVILILNAGGPVWTDRYSGTDRQYKGIFKYFSAWSGRGRCPTDAILGKEVPGGKLTTTWAKAIRGLSGFRRVWVSEWQSGKRKNIKRRYLCRLQIF